MSATRDPEIRATLLAFLGRDPAMWVRGEVGLHGTAVVDVLAATETHLCGYEIKSEVDTLARLPTQAIAYGWCLDRVTLVCAPRHFEKAVGRVPPWWGVVLASRRADGTLDLTSERGGRDNPGLMYRRVAGLLWRDELRDVLTRRGIARGALGSKDRMLARLEERVPLDDMRAEVRARLRTRTWDDPKPAASAAGAQVHP